MSEQKWPDLPNEYNVTTSIESRQEEEARLCKMVMTTLEKELKNWDAKDFLERSTLRKNFSGYTDMPIEEMIARLKKLEDAIQRQASTSEFVEPLRKLAAYQRTCYLYTETELLVNMMVDDLNRMIQECFTTSFSDQRHDSNRIEKTEATRRERPNIPRYI